MNVLNERTLKGTFFGNYKPRSDLPSVVEKYMNKVSLVSLKLYDNSNKFLIFVKTVVEKIKMFLTMTLIVHFKINS